eukprot:TRINITY_DN4224_c0_g1_i1.p1 TRINITY_DN4224_c0_g1~~TRINITY_DN4224_c0_g1_i1.p1  ORF type:complete len:73 (-),score=11.98 TRINITY_DN4224_c0_g1_i1:9-227(-)
MIRCDNSFGHSGEIARAHITAAKVGRLGENYFLGGNGTHPIAELIAQMARYSGLQNEMPNVIAPIGYCLSGY